VFAVNLHRSCQIYSSGVPSLVLCFCFRSCSMICLLQLRSLARSTIPPPSGLAYYRLGKKRPCSGILSRYSRFALTIQAMPTMLPRTRPMTAVLALQLAGWEYQPPAGDQTCLGYLPLSALHRGKQ
jgi:hypothetical protein